MIRSLKITNEGNESIELIVLDQEYLIIKVNDTESISLNREELQCVLNELDLIKNNVK